MSQIIDLKGGFTLLKSSMVIHLLTGKAATPFSFTEAYGTIYLVHT